MQESATPFSHHCLIHEERACARVDGAAGDMFADGAGVPAAHLLLAPGDVSEAPTRVDQDQGDQPSGGAQARTPLATSDTI